MITPTYTKELELLKDFRLVAGIDEVGRGPLAGPVVSAVVILNPEKIGKYRSKTKWWSGVRDSKTVPAEKREALSEFIKENAVEFAIGEASNEEIDELNIHHASLLSMRRAVENLHIKPEMALIDGRFQIPDLDIAQKFIVDGDAKVLSIAAASILAKVHRDFLMKKFAEEFPQFGFDRHKGYNTFFHRKQIISHGPCRVHRMTFPAMGSIMSRRFGILTDNL